MNVTTHTRPAVQYQADSCIRSFLESMSGVLSLEVIDESLNSVKDPAPTPTTMRSMIASLPISSRGMVCEESTSRAISDMSIRIAILSCWADESS